MAKSTHDQIKAVHTALYKRGRMRRLSDLMHNLAVSMNLDPSADLPASDVRYPPGSGPQWFFPDTGALDNLVSRSAGYCDQIAQTILAMRGDIQQVNFPKADKQNLSKALSKRRRHGRSAASSGERAASPEIPIRPPPGSRDI